MRRFVISEDERRRILSMHESATKRQYLSEQSGGSTISDAAAKAIYDKAGEYWEAGKKSYAFIIPETPGVVYTYDWPRDFEPGNLGFWFWKSYYDKNSGSITVQQLGNFQISSPSYLAPGETPVYKVVNMESVPLGSSTTEIDRYPVGALPQGAVQHLITSKFNELGDAEKNKFIQYAKNKPFNEGGLGAKYSAFIDTLSSKLNTTSDKTNTTNTTNTAG
jgi:hypothetical protein